MAAVCVCIINIFNAVLVVKITQLRESEHLRKAESFCDRVRKLLAGFRSGKHMYVFGYYNYIFICCGYKERMDIFFSASDISYLDLISPISESIDLQWTLRDGRLVNLPTLLVVKGYRLDLK